MHENNWYGDKYRVHDLVKFNYSDIGEYIDENHTDKPLRNDELVDLLNKQEEQIQELEIEVLDLRVEVGRLNSKKEIEEPHWLKYKSSKGYTGQANQDIRFSGDKNDK